MTKKYHPEKYWTEVAKRIREREDGHNIIAGDDEPYYRYKRERFLNLLDSIDVAGKSVLEIGSGPGGNLLELFRKKPSKLAGVDISEEMVELAKNKLPEVVSIQKINGSELPFTNDSFDVVLDRKSTRLNSSHVAISYAVFCLKKNSE